MKKDAYSIKAGDTFVVDGKTYTATKDARGEFRPYIMVVDERAKDGESEIVLQHGQDVEIVEPEQQQPTFSPEHPLPVHELWTDGDRSRKYIMRCRIHPELKYRSKDPFASQIFADQPKQCDCSWTELEVIGREQ
jgi:hypothetical protein